MTGTIKPGTIKRAAQVGVLALGIVAVLAAPAAAHVTIDPPSVPKGSTVRLSFLVPDEEPPAKTNEVQIFFPPAPNAIPGVSVEAKPGWTFTITNEHLTTPIVTDDGNIDTIVSSIDWKATSAASAIGKDEFGEFTIDADGIPTKTDQLVFKAVQTYTNHQVVRWVDPVTPGGPDAVHPTPILQLTNPTSGNEATPTTTATGATTTSASTQDNSARALGIVGVVLGALALLAATGALMRKRRTA